MQFYFIGGLGGNGYHLAPLIDELGFPVTFLDPYREMIQTEKDLCAWFQDQIGQDEEICLLGHSLGGDLARYLAAEFPQIRALILLDGGYLDMEKILPLEEQYELNLDLEKVLALLRLRRQIKANQISITDKPVLFIGPLYQEEPGWRKAALNQLDPNIQQVLLEGLGHELYTEAPQAIAIEVNNWLQNVHK